MSEKRRHRGPAPEDRLFDDPNRLRKLRQAVEDLSWLLERGYSSKAASELVANRYQLTARERLAMAHAAWNTRRREAPLGAEELSGHRLCIDGFNLLITLESALGGAVLIRGRDGLLRDIANVHGHYTLRAETEEALKLAAEASKELKVREALWIFDRPVSNSGRIAALVETIGREKGIAMRGRTADGVDRLLKNCEGVVVSADSAILESGVLWFDLGGWIVERFIPQAKIVDLGGSPHAESRPVC